MREKWKKLYVSTLLVGCFLFFYSNVAEAGSFVYPKTSHSISEIYQKHDDFNGGNPGKFGNEGHLGKKGNPGKEGKHGKRGKSGKHGKNGKGRLIVVY